MSSAGLPASKPLPLTLRRRGIARYRAHDMIGAVLFAALLSALPFAWVTLAQFGPVYLKPVHLSLLAILLLLPVAASSSRVYREAVLAVLQQGKWVLASCAAYLAALLLSALLGPGADLTRAFAIVAKQGAFGVSAVGVAVLVATWSERTRAIVFAVAAALALLTFFYVLQQALLDRGSSLTAFLLGKSGSGSLTLRIEMMSAIWAAAEVDVSSNLRLTLVHNIMNGLFVAVMVLAAALASLRHGVMVRIAGWAALAAVTVFLANSSVRSTILALTVVALVVTVSGRWQRGISLNKLLLGLALMAGLLMLALLGWERIETVAINAIGDERSINSRFAQYQLALNSIERSPWLGAGMGATVLGGSVHNLFLRAWFEGGVICFALGIVFYGVLAQRFCYAAGPWVLNRPWSLSISPALAAGFLVLPLVRLLVTASEMNLAEWICIALFLGLMAANRLRSGADRSA